MSKSTPTTETSPVPLLEDLDQAYKGSYLTILGAGGDLREWVDGLSTILDKEGIGVPSAWYRTNGAAVNLFAQDAMVGSLAPDDTFPSDLTILMFPLDGLEVGRLALWRLVHDARWFDDLIDNMRHTSRRPSYADDDAPFDDLVER